MSRGNRKKYSGERAFKFEGVIATGVIRPREEGVSSTVGGPDLRVGKGCRQGENGYRKLETEN